MLKRRVSVVLIMMLLSGAAYAKTGKQLFEEKCQLCHLLPQKRDLPGGKWPGRIDAMIDYLKLDVEDKNRLLDYIDELVTGKGTKN